MHYKDAVILLQSKEDRKSGKTSYFANLNETQNHKSGIKTIKKI